MIEIDKNDSTPIYRQIESKLKNKILREELAYGTRLPSERRLAAMLGVNRNTVVKAYERLSDQGYISSQIPGSRGYFVVFGGGDDNGVGMERPAVFDYSSSLNVYEKEFLDVYESSFAQEKISFGGHILPDSLICMEDIKEIIAETVEKYGVEAFSYCSAKGHPLLRKQLSLSLEEEGIGVTPGQVAIINETAQGIEYIIHVLTREHDYIVTEYPIMPETYMLFKVHGLQILAVSMEEDGVDLVQLENLFKRYRPKFFHTMPDYHAVTACRMSLEKRKEVLRLSYQYNVPVLEERWFWGVDFSEDMLPSLFALDQRQNVILIDNALTRFYHGAKTAFLAAPLEITDRVWRNVSGIQSHLQSLEQLMFVEYLKSGYDRRQKARIASYYGSKYRIMEAELEQLRGLGVSWNSPGGGLGIWCSLPKGIHDVQLYKDLRKRDVLVCPGRFFYPMGTDEGPHIRLSFSNISDENIKKGAAILYEEIRKKCKK